MAAAIHLGILPVDRAPAQVEWERVFYRTGFAGPDQGGVFLMGRTRAGDEIYILAYPAKPDNLVAKTAFSALELMAVSPEECRLIDCGTVGRSFPQGNKPSASAIQAVYPLLAQLVMNIEGGVKP